MHQIALIEDNEELRRLTSLFLQRAGFTVSDFEDAEDLLASPYSFALYVVDINLPEMDGYSLVERIRCTYPNVGIIILSARERTVDVATGYGKGADIYLTKPTDPTVLLSAVKRMMSRVENIGKDNAAISLIGNCLRFGDLQQMLSSSEALLLRNLSLAGERGLERYEIANCLSLNVDVDFSKALEIRILRLRKKMKKIGVSSDAIETIRGRGYRLKLKINFDGVASSVV